jgi:hypothetical protein
MHNIFKIYLVTSVGDCPFYTQCIYFTLRTGVTLKGLSFGVPRSILYGDIMKVDKLYYNLIRSTYCQPLAVLRPIIWMNTRKCYHV